MSIEENTYVETDLFDAEFDAEQSAALFRKKSIQSHRIMATFLETGFEYLRQAAICLSENLAQGGKLLIIGNGGSGCDANHLAIEFMHPIIDTRPAYPAIVLNENANLINAIGNDHDASLCFSAQLPLLAKPNDVLIGYSTSGESENLIRAFEYAKQSKLNSIGILGRNGGRMAALCDYPLIVPSYNIHRVQEAHLQITHMLWDFTHLLQGSENRL